MRNRYGQGRENEEESPICGFPINSIEALENGDYDYIAVAVMDASMSKEWEQL